MADSCNTCVYFIVGAVPGFGECHRDTPRLVVRPSGAMLEWPPVSQADWCGSFSTILMPVPSGPQAGARNSLLQPTTYYVRPDGSDGNDGTANTPNHAFLTVNGAYYAIADSVDAQGQPIIISMADGTYTGDIVIASRIVGMQRNSSVSVTPGITLVGGIGVTLIGVDTNPTLAVKNGAALAIDGGMTITNNTGGHAVDVTEGSFLFVNNVKFGAASLAHMVAERGGIIELFANYSIGGAATNHLWAINQGQIFANGLTVTISGTPAFSDTFVRAQQGGLVEALSMTFSGGTTGSRFITGTSGIINTNGGGATYFPGNVGGTTGAATFGLYL